MVVRPSTDARQALTTRTSTTRDAGSAPASSTRSTLARAAFSRYAAGSFPEAIARGRNSQPNCTSPRWLPSISVSAVLTTSAVERVVGSRSRKYIVGGGTTE